MLLMVDTKQKRKVEISLAEVYERVWKCAISVFKRTGLTTTLFIFPRKKAYFAWARSYIFFHLYCYLGIVT